MDFDVRQRGGLDKRIQCFPWKDNGQCWPLGSKAPSLENKTRLSDTNSAKLIIASSFNIHCCSVTCTWLGRKRTAGSPFLVLIHMSDVPAGWAGYGAVDYSTNGWEESNSKCLFFIPMKPVNVHKTWRQKASNKWIHFLGKWYGSLFITALWKWNQFYVSLHNNCLLGGQIYGREPLVNQNIYTFLRNSLNTHSLLLSEQLQDCYRWCGVSLAPSSKRALTAT